MRLRQPHRRTAPGAGAHAMRDPIFPAGEPVRIEFSDPEIIHLDIAGREFRGMRIEGMGVRMEPGLHLLPRRRVLVDISDLPVGENGGVAIRVTATGRRVIAIGGVDRAPVIAEAAQRDGVSEGVLAMDAPAPAETAADTPNVSGSDSASGSDSIFVKFLYTGWSGRRRIAAFEVTPVVPFGDSSAHFAPSLQWYVLPSVSAGSGVGAHTPPASHPSHPHTAPFTTTSTGASFPPVQWALRIDIDSKGIYQLTPADFQAAGISAAAVLPERLVMFRDGKVYPIHQDDGGDGMLDGQDRILFYGEGLDSLYTRKRAHFLYQINAPAASQFGPRSRMQSVDGSPVPSIPAAASYRHNERFEVNALYWQLMPNGTGKDHWFWKKTLAPATNNYSLFLFDPAVPAANPMTIRVGMHGYTDAPQNPDHHTRILLNSAVIGDALWNGVAPFVQEISVPVPAGSPPIVNGTNTLAIQQVADTGAIVDGIYTDAIDISYDRYFFAKDSQVAFPYSKSAQSTFVVRSFPTAGIIGLDVTNPFQTRRIISGTPGGIPTSNNLTVTVPADAAAPDPGRYIFASGAGIKSPVSIRKQEKRYVPPAAGADWIVIAPKAFSSALGPLIAHRAAQALRVEFVTTETIFDHFGNGHFGPEAVRDFIKMAWETFPAPAPSYVLLVGDASLDCLNYTGAGIQTIIPAPVKQVFSDGEIPSDHYYACLNGNDPIPEIQIGRIPAADAAAVAIVVQKTIEREIAPPTGPWKTTASLFADRGASFVNAIQTVGSHVPSGITKNVILADSYATNAAMRAAVIAELNAGAAIATYIGHGSSGTWGNIYLNNTDATNLTNAGRHQFSVVVNCSNGYFANPFQQYSLAESQLFSPNGGAAATYCSAGLSYLSLLVPLVEDCFDHFFNGETFGFISTGAKLDSYLNGGGSFEDNLWQNHLFGDPAGVGIPQ